MVVNFRTRRINQGACKLTCTLILIIIKKHSYSIGKTNSENLTIKNLLVFALHFLKLINI